MRGLHRAGGDFITQSVTDSDHISGGRGRHAQPPATDPGGCRAPPSRQCAGIGLGPPRWETALGWQRRFPAAPCGPGITPNWPIYFPPGREAAATSLADHHGIAKVSKETLLGLAFLLTPPPSLEQPCIPLQGKLLLCSPSVCRAHRSQRTHLGEILLQVEMIVW